MWVSIFVALIIAAACLGIAIFVMCSRSKNAIRLSASNATAISILSACALREPNHGKCSELREENAGVDLKHIKKCMVS